MERQRLIQLYAGMLRIHLVETRIADLYPEQEMRCPVHLCLGQEAVPVGVCAHLAPEDYVLSGHRSHGHYLAKGGDLKRMLAELYGKATGCAGGKGGSMHLVDLAVGFLGATPIVASTIPIAVGTAFAAVRRGESRVTAIFFGDGAVEEGVFHEALNFAVLHRLPVVFVCENNRYSVYSPLSVRQPAHREIARLAEGHGLPAVQGDGNDVVAVDRLAGEAVARARAGEGPTFLELLTYRTREHCGPFFDDDLGYRPPAEVAAWRGRDALERLRATLDREGEAAALDALRADLEREIDAAVAFARESPFPEPERMDEQVYAP